MKYRVIKQFADSQDGLYVYQAGDSFPRNGKSVDAERINELLGDKNALSMPLIEEIAEKEVAEKIEENPKPKKAAKAKIKE